MLSFKDFIRIDFLDENVNLSEATMPQQKMGEHVATLNHPVKGEYRVHKIGDYHHVYNEYGEPLSTYYKTETEDVVEHLKDEHGMHSINEDKGESASLNVHRGGYNEGMFAYHLNNKKWVDESHHQETQKHKFHLDNYHPEEAKIQEDRAKAQVKSFVAHAKQAGYSGIKKVHLTAKPGDIEKKTGIKASQQDNPSDVIVEFKNHPKTAKHGFLGVSLKSSKSKKIGFHNGGAGTIGKQLGVDLEGTANKMHDEFIHQHGLSQVKSQAHDQIKGEGSAKRNNPLYEKGLAHATTIHKKLRDMLHKKYESMDQSAVKKHLLGTFIKAGSNKDSLPYVKTHGQGGGSKEAEAHTTDPSDNEEYHMIKKAKKIHFEKSGDSYINVHADGKRVFGIQVKHNSGPLTSLKVLGQP